jgi:homogentisate 1,2-dioxygenase
MSITKINVFEQAKSLEQPFLVVDLAEVDDFAARLFVSQGMVHVHRHIDQEQLFYTLDGELTLETEWGNTTLRSGEMAVIPKAVAHSCGSVARATALVFERRYFSNRQNGQRRLFVLEGEGELSPVSIGAEALELEGPAVPRRLVTVDELALSLVKYQGEAPERCSQHGSELLLIHQDSVNLETELETISLTRGDITVVPKGAPYRVQAPGSALVVLAAKSAPEQT